MVTSSELVHIRSTNCANAPNLVSFVTIFYIGRSGHNFDRRALRSEEFVLPTVPMPHIGSRKLSGGSLPRFPSAGLETLLT